MIAIIGPVAALGTLAVLPASAGLQPKTRFPQVRPGDLLRAAIDISQLSEQGLQPQVSTDPFTGDFVVSTADQPVGSILEERALAAATAGTAADIEEIRQLRQQIIEARRGFSVPPQRPTARSSQPGVVSRGERVTSTLDSRPNVNRSRAARAQLSSRCAGRTNAFNCLRALG